MTAQASTPVHPARHLVIAIDALTAFVKERCVVSQSSIPRLDADERNKLSDLEGKVTGLLAVVADGKLPFQSQPSDSQGQTKRHFTSGTGIEYSISPAGMLLRPSYHWQAKMQTLRIAAQTIAEVEEKTIIKGGQSDKKPDAKKKRRIRGPRNISQLLQLKKAIERGAIKGLTMEESALEFTDGDQTKAESLLRSFRRHRNHPGLV